MVVKATGHAGFSFVDTTHNSTNQVYYKLYFNSVMEVRLVLLWVVLLQQYKRYRVRFFNNMNNLNKHKAVVALKNVVSMVDDQAFDADGNEDFYEEITAVNTKKEELDIQAKETLKDSAKAKLIAGEALTEEEANTIVL